MAAEADGFPERVAEAVCTGAAACCGRAGVTPNAPACRTAVERQVREALPVIDAAGRAYHPEQAARCLEELDRVATSCDPAFFHEYHCGLRCGRLRPLFACDSTFTLDATERQACSVPSDCVPALSTVTVCSEGVCRRAALGGELDDPCVGACDGPLCSLIDPALGVPRPGDTLCDVAAHGYCDYETRVCTPNPASGEACGFGCGLDDTAQLDCAGICSPGVRCSGGRKCYEPAAQCADNRPSQCPYPECDSDADGGCAVPPACHELTLAESESCNAPRCQWDVDAKICRTLPPPVRPVSILCTDSVAALAPQQVACSLHLGPMTISADDADDYDEACEE